MYVRTYGSDSALQIQFKCCRLSATIHLATLPILFLNVQCTIFPVHKMAYDRPISNLPKNSNSNVSNLFAAAAAVVVAVYVLHLIVCVHNLRKSIHRLWFWAYLCVCCWREEGPERLTLCIHQIFKVPKFTNCMQKQCHTIASKEIDRNVE